MIRQASFVLAVSLAAAGVAHADPNPETRRRAAVQALEQRAQLDEAKAQRAQEVIDRYREPIKSARAERRAAGRALAGLLRTENPKDARARTLETAITRSTATLRRLEADRMRDLGRVLSATELGRVMLSWKQINHDLRHGKSVS